MIPTKDLPKLQSIRAKHFGDSIGQFKIEHQSDSVVIINGSCYHMDDSHYRVGGHTKAEVATQPSIRDYYMNLL
jgi:hypothetical protein